MPLVLGVDGCHAGWLAVTRDRGKLEYQVFSALRELTAAHTDAELILIDVPIGLPWKDAPIRPCDSLARKMLGRLRGSSVFPVPCREALLPECDHAAVRANLRVLGRSLSKQTLAIRKKIAEADSLLLTANPRPPLREVHPEVCFTQLAGGHPMTEKKIKPGGRSERRQVLARCDAEVIPFADRLLSQTKRPMFKKTTFLTRSLRF